MYIIRQHVREDICTPARVIISAEVLSVIPCLMLDVSPQGSKVKMGINYTLPDHTFLIRDDNDVLFSCSTRWQDERLVGLMFIDLGTRSERKRIMQMLKHAIILGPLPEKDEPPASQPVAAPPPASEVAAPVPDAPAPALV